MKLYINCTCGKQYELSGSDSKLQCSCGLKYLYFFDPTVEDYRLVILNKDGHQI